MFYLFDVKKYEMNSIQNAQKNCFILYIAYYVLYINFQ